jgi:glycosyltransferase involved in cell wall biosynthesis
MACRISVLVPTYNRARFLRASLDSILSQTLPAFEVIVIDDGSTDETAEIVREYGDRLVYLPKANEGKSTALNLGLQHVRGDYVWIMDDDDVALPHALDRLVAPLEADRDLGMSFGTHLIADTLPDGTVGETVERTLPTFPDSDLFLALVQHGNLIGQAAFLARTVVCQQVGPYNTALIRSQDFEMVLRLSAACRAVRVSGPMYIYRQHGQLRGSDADRHTAADKLRKWRFYDTIIYRRLLQDIPLHRYLPAAASLSPSGVPLRRAHLQRAAMLWRSGLFDEFFCDLEQALKIPGLLSNDERQVLSGGYPLDEREDYWDGEHIRNLRLRTASRVGRQIRTFLAQGVYWRARLELTAGRYRLAWRDLRACLSILGWAGVPYAVNYKVGSLFHPARKPPSPDAADGVDRSAAIQHLRGGDG